MKVRMFGGGFEEFGATRYQIERSHDHILFLGCSVGLESCEFEGIIRA